jgi:four helix bundle protein
MLQNHKGLEVWDTSVELAADIYKLTSFLPPEEKYGMSGQMRSAAVSVASNIAEGAARGSKKEFVRFLNIAAGSASELDTQLEILLRIGAIDSNKVISIKNKLESVAKMIQGLIKALR